MSLIDNLTPAGIEEVRPGLFINTNNKVVYPLAYNGQWLIKQRLKEVLNTRTVVTIVLVLLLAWRYQEETSYCQTLQTDPCSLLLNITEHCSKTDFYNDQNTFTIPNSNQQGLRV